MTTKCNGGNLPRSYIEKQRARRHYWVNEGNINTYYTLDIILLSEKFFGVNNNTVLRQRMSAFLGNRC